MSDSNDTLDSGSDDSDSTGTVTDGGTASSSPTLPKAVSITHLTFGALGNHNAGEGGGNVSTLKRYGNRPYISGQAYRHAIQTALRTHVPSGINCVPKHACGHLSECVRCDLFGYMRADSNLEHKKRLSPISVTPMLGVYDTDVVADLILQYDIDVSDNRLAHREMTENVYHGSISIDVDAIGRREDEQIDTSKDDADQYSREFIDELEEIGGDQERLARLQQLLTAIQYATKFAGQSRHMADFMPDLIVVAAQEHYTHRLSNALHVDPETGELNETALESVLSDIVNMGGKIWIAGSYNPIVIDNWEAVEAVVDRVDGVTMVRGVAECFDQVRAEVDGINFDSMGTETGTAD